MPFSMNKYVYCFNNGMVLMDLVEHDHRGMM